MKELQQTAIGEVRIAEVPVPEPKPGQVLVKSRGAAVFRSEFIPLLRGEDPRTREGDFLFPKSGFPRGFGADVVADIVKVGDGVTDFKVGDRVALPGKVAEYGVKQTDHLIRVAPHLTDPEATFPVHAGVVLHGVRKLDVRVGDTALVIGQGPLGIVASQLIKAAGAGRVIAADLFEGRLERARQCGVDHAINSGAEDLHERVFELTDGKGADVVIEATAVAKCVEEAIRAVRKQGQVLVLGFHGHPFTIEKPIENFLFREAVLIGTFASSPDDRQTTADLMAHGRLDVKPLTSHELSFNDVEEALRLVEEEPEKATRIHVNFN